MNVDERLLSLRWRVVRALTPRRTVETRGVRISLQCDNQVTHYRWKNYNEKEPETLDWLDRCLKDGDTLFDVGANIGAFTLYAALRYPRLRVVSFEPEYSNLHLLRDNVLVNGLQDRVQVYAIALSDRTGVSQLYIQDTLPGSALHTESVEVLERTLTGHSVVWREGVSAMTLDDFCRQTETQPQVLKLDVDGTESRILEGAQKTLSSPALRSVLVEMPRDPQAYLDCERWLTAAGLKRAWNDPTGVIANQIWAR